jgi:DNA-directed RNA polymerase subunit RPC12/RpoP
VKPRERFSGTPGVACPLCLSKNATRVTARDPKRGLMQTIYRCGDCKSYFGDLRETQSAPRASKP